MNAEAVSSSTTVLVNMMTVVNLRLMGQFWKFIALDY
jgi:hypothetical protein